MLVEFSGVNTVYSHKAVVVQLPKFKMADGRHIENRFWQYLSAILPD